MKFGLLISLFYCCTTQASSTGSTLDTPHPWGDFPKDFRVGYKHPEIMGKAGTEISSQYILKVINQWNNPTKLSKQLINAEMGCVKGVASP